MSNPHSNASDKGSILGPTLVLKGELIAQEDLVLKGRVEGSIQHTASLKISKEGSVKGNVKAKQIAVDGTVEGNLFCAETVTVEASARVTGDIHSRRVNLIEGARFKGRIDMDYSEAAEARPAGSRAATAGK